jgi:hypothetical protein
VAVEVSVLLVRVRARAPNQSKVSWNGIEHNTRTVGVELKTWMTKLNPMGDHVGAVNRSRSYGDGARIVREICVRSTK